MANGVIVKAVAVWEGEMEIGGVKTHGSFEVFDSGDSWEFLFGKPLLTDFNATHEYKADTVTVENKGLMALLKNQNDTNGIDNEEHQHCKKEEQIQPSESEVYFTKEEPNYNTSTITEIKLDAIKKNDNVFTRHTDPWKKERVDENTQTSHSGIRLK